MRSSPVRQQRCAACLAILLCACWSLASFGQSPRGGPFTLPEESVPLEPVPFEPLPPPVASSPLLAPPVEGEIELGRDGVLGPGVLTGLAEGEIIDSPAFPFGYNLRQSNTSWLVGNGDDFGMFSLESLPTLPQNRTWGIGSGMGFHFLGGPIQTDMPPRLFDFQIGLQNRKWLSESFGYDVSAVVGAFSDFEGSARQGVRYPSHAVGYYRWSPAADLVFGLDYLDRDDYHMLPVAGVILTPHEDLRLEIVFPHPRAELRISPKQSIYLAGELGGGTWAIERTTKTDDVVTYRDLRMLFGIATRNGKEGVSTFELGYVFARDLSYRSSIGNMDLQDTLLVRCSHLY
jgi:hypothetical protein